MVITPTNQINLNSPLKCNSAWVFFAMPMCYVGMFIVFGVVLEFPHSGTIGDKVAYIVTQEFNLSLAYIIGYLVFGSLLLIAVQTTYNQLNTTTSQLLKYASAFGFIWVVLMMCSGMIAVVGLNTMVKLHGQGSLHAETLFLIYTTVVNGLGGGIELVGALWVFLISLHGLKSSQMSQALNLFGLVVGITGILTLYQAVPEFKDAFGILQIVWFVLMGLTLLKKNKS